MSQQEVAGIEYAPGKYMVGKSPAMQRVFFLLKQYAPSSAPVLVTGETGTGKELAARAVHYHSGRTGTFVTVNCASVSDGLFESEFFGHRRGAFTGALADRSGYFEQADEGTLFLDEVGEMPLNQQAKLLRAIEDGNIMPVGATQPVSVSARIVAATNTDMDKALQEGRFRQDLLDRLNVLPLGIPPLGERVGDLRYLTEHFLSFANEEEGTQTGPITSGALRGLEANLDQSNLRRLRNVIRRIVVVKRKGPIEAADLAESPLTGSLHTERPYVRVDKEPTGKTALRIELANGSSFKDIMQRVGRALTNAALDKHGGRVGDAMRALDMSKDVWYRVRRE